MLRAHHHVGIQVTTLLPCQCSALPSSRSQWKIQTGLRSQISACVGCQAYETLSVLEGTSNMAETALKRGTKLKPEDQKNLAFYFNKVTLLRWTDQQECMGRHHASTAQLLALQRSIY